MFIVTLDILKYCFGIDTVGSRHKKLQSTKRKKYLKRKKPVTAIRFIYVNAPPPEQPSVNPIPTVEETTV
jgi:hypothetical protein